MKRQGRVVQVELGSVVEDRTIGNGVRVWETVGKGRVVLFRHLESQRLRPQPLFGRESLREGYVYTVCVKYWYWR